MMIRPNPHRQRGFTMIELMVGLVISMVSVLAMLALYKTAATVTAASKLGANVDGQIAAGLVSADRFMQSAGYKYGDNTATAASYKTDVVLITGATLTGATLAGTASTATPTTTATSGNALVWLYNASGTYQLQGLYAPTTGGLYMLTASVAGTPPTLTSSTTWSGATWTSQALITPPSATIPNATNAGQTSISISSIALGNQCQPFSASFIPSTTTVGGQYYITLSVTGYAGNSQALNSVTCLANISS